MTQDKRVTFYFCGAGRGSVPEQKKFGHYVREDHAVKREKDGKRLCPDHLVPLELEPTVLFEPNSNKTYENAVFDAAASGNLRAAVEGKVCKLHAFSIQAQGTVIVNLNNGVGGASLLEKSYQDREGDNIPFSLIPWAVTTKNTILYVTLSAAIVVTITAIISVDDEA